MNCNTFQLKLHGKKTISRVQNCTRKKRSRVCKIARKKSDLACAKSHEKKAISRVSRVQLPVPIAIWNISDNNMFSKNNSVNNRLLVIL